MAKLLATLVLSLPLIGFGTGYAQNAAPTTSQQHEPPKSTVAPTAHSSANGKLQLFKTEADAKSHCGSDEVVWGNSSSHVLHDSGTKYYGKTKHGGYACKQIAISAGYHEAKE